MLSIKILLIFVYVNHRNCNILYCIEFPNGSVYVESGNRFKPYPMVETSELHVNKCEGETFGISSIVLFDL
jgi:hypothetical protein